MADPVSWAGISAAFATVVEVAGSVIAAFGTFLSAIQGFVITMYFVAKIVVTITSNILYSFLMIFLLPLNGCFGFFFLNTELIMKDLRSDKFPNKPPKRNLDDNIGVMDIIQTTFFEIRTVIVDLFVYLSPLLIAAPWIFLVGVFFVINGFLMMWFTKEFFLAVDYVYLFYTLYLEMVATFMNASVTYLISIIPLWNSFMDFLYEMAIVIFKLFCPAPYLTGDVEADCPILFQIYQLIRTQWDFYVQIIILLYDSFVAILVTIGNTICPGGTCPIDLCQKVLGTNICYWDFSDPTFIIKFIFSVILEVFQTIIYVVFITLYFALDLSKLFIASFGFILRKYISPQMMTSLNSLQKLPWLKDFNVPAHLADLKAFNVFFENVTNSFFYIIASTISTGYSVLDGLFCNVFRTTCGIGKACVTLFYNVCIPKTTLCIDFRKLVCTDILKVKTSDCFHSCDRCAFKPFGISLYMEWWKDANKYWFGDPNAGYGFTSCNLETGCCAVAYSTIQYFFPY